MIEAYSDFHKPYKANKAIEELQQAVFSDAFIG